MQERNGVMEAPHLIGEDGTCNTCSNAVNVKHLLECYKCKSKYHGYCENNAIFCTKTFLNLYVGLQNNSSFKFICPHCITQSETMEASNIKEQLAEVVSALSKLTEEVHELKKRKSQDQVPALKKTKSQDQVPRNQPKEDLHDNSKQSKSAWTDKEGLKQVKNAPEVVTLCIRSEGESIDMSKVKEVITANGIQVKKASVMKTTGDVYINLPNTENKDKLNSLLQDVTEIPSERIVDVKQKYPTISLRNVQDYIDKETFAKTIIKQNHKISEKVQAGSEFAVVYAKEQKLSDRSTETSMQNFMVVVRVSNDIRDIIKENGDRIYHGTLVHRVWDRFYVKTCAKCHRYGHYHAECTAKPCCGYCMDEAHTSENCQIYKNKDYVKFKCVNCKEKDKDFSGHSSHYNKCPTYVEMQKKTKLNIPYYKSKNYK